VRQFLKNVWRKLRTVWPDSWSHRVTQKGVAFSFALLLVGLAAFLSGNNLLFLILAAMISTFLISSFVSRLGLAGLELDLVLPEHISARRRVRAGMRLKNLKRWMPSFSIHLAGAAESGFDSMIYFPVLAGGATVEEPIDVYFPRRGSQKERAFRFSTRFPFGFAERREMVTTRHEILVYPCLDPQPGFEALLTSVTGDLESVHKGRGNDFYRIRPYEAMESARHVDWKVTAHTGSLQVREFAREEDQRVEICLDLDVPRNQEGWFETAVEGAAFLAYRLAARGTLIRFATQAFSVTLPETGDIYTILKYLALAAPIRGAGPWGPDDTNSFQIVFTANPQRMSALGWGTGAGSHMLHPDSFPGGNRMGAGRG
jgi:uncharacterized protein (DUF58 family)